MVATAEWLRGNWKPGRFPTWVPLAIQLVLIGQMTVRGIDYVGGDSPELTRSLGLVERSIPLPVWGCIYLASASLLIIGIVLARASVVAVGHFVGAAIYLAIGYGVFRSNFDIRGLDGIRTAAGLIGGGLIHLLFGVGTMARKVADDIRASLYDDEESGWQT